MYINSHLFSDVYPQFLELFIEHPLQLALTSARGISNQSLAPVVVDHGGVLLQVQLLYHFHSQLVVAEFQQLPQQSLRHQLLKLLVSNGSSAGC